MGEAPGERPLHAHCALCGAAIRWGDRLVHIARFDEQVREDGDVEVKAVDTLAFLCDACGARHPAATVRLDLGGRSFRGTEGRGW